MRWRAGMGVNHWYLLAPGTAVTARGLRGGTWGSFLCCAGINTAPSPTLTPLWSQHAQLCSTALPASPSSCLQSHQDQAVQEGCRAPGSKRCRRPSSAWQGDRSIVCGKRKVPSPSSPLPRFPQPGAQKGEDGRRQHILPYPAHQRNGSGCIAACLPPPPPPPLTPSTAPGGRAGEKPARQLRSTGEMGGDELS